MKHERLEYLIIALVKRMGINTRRNLSQILENSQQCFMPKILQISSCRNVSYNEEEAIDCPSKITISKLEGQEQPILSSDNCSRTIQQNYRLQDSPYQLNNYAPTLSIVWASRPHVRLTFLVECLKYLPDNVDLGAYLQVLFPHPLSWFYCQKVPKGAEPLRLLQ